MVIMNANIRAAIAELLEANATTVEDLERFIADMSNFIYFAKVAADEARECNEIREITRNMHNVSATIANNTDAPKYTGNLTMVQKNHLGAAMRG